MNQVLLYPVIFFASVCVSTNRLITADGNIIFEGFDQLVETRAEAVTLLLKKVAYSSAIIAVGSCAIWLIILSLLPNHQQNGQNVLFRGGVRGRGLAKANRQTE